MMKRFFAALIVLGLILSVSELSARNVITYRPFD